MFSGGKASTLETYKEDDSIVQDSDQESEHVVAEKDGELDTTAKVIKLSKDDLKCKLFT